MKQIEIPVNNSFTISNHHPFALLSGPCQIESLQHAIDMAGQIKEICTKLQIPFIYKSSFDKANRTSVDAKRGVGLEQGLKILAEVKKQHDIAIVTDVHLPDQCAEVAEIADILQIPAFLCRQTDLVIAAAETGKIINIKKGQFLAPWDMQNVLDKAASTGNDKLMACERGASFGYNMLVSDMRSLVIMAETGYPIVYDATHSVQQPGGMGASSGGKRQYIKPLAKAAVAVGIAALFIETHQDPDNAPSDGPSMLPLNELENLLFELKTIDKLNKN